MREKESYVAKVGFVIGDTEQKIEPGTEIVFDGHKAWIEGEEPIVFPRFKSVINAGWVTRQDSDDGGRFQPKSAEIQVSPSTPQKSGGKFQTVTTQVDEQVIGSFRDRKKLQKTALDQSRGITSPDEVIQEGAQSVVKKVESKNVGREGEVQNRTLVSKETLSAVKKEIKDIEDVKGEAKTTSVMQEGIVFQQEGISRQASGGQEVEKTNGMIATAEDGIQVGTIRGKNRVRVEADVGITDVQLDPEPEPEPEPKPKPDSKVRRGRKPKVDETIVKTVKDMCPDFPESWDFYASTKEKSDNIQEHLDRPDIVRAIFLAETDSFKKVLKQDFPQFWD